MDPTLSAPTGGPANPQSQSSGGVVLRTDSLLAKHGSDKHDAKAFGALPPKPGSNPRGRPRKDGLPAGSSIPPQPSRNPPLVAPLAPPSTPDTLPRPAFDPIVVRKSVESVIDGVNVIAVGIVHTKASKVFPPGEARQLSEGVRCPAASRETLSMAIPALMEKWGWSSEYCPEIAVLGGLGGWLGGVGVVIKRIDHLIDKMEEEKKPKLQDPPPSNASA